MMNSEDDGFFSLSNETSKVYAVTGISIVTSLLSFLGTGSVILCSIYHRRVLFPEIFPTFHLAVADFLGSVSVLVNSATFLSDVLRGNGDGSAMGCSIVSGLIISFYTSAFLMTAVHALEALFRFKNKLKPDVSNDLSQVSPVSSRWMYIVYAFAWLAPLIPEVFLMIKIHRQKTGACSLCFADFRFDEKSCWTKQDPVYLHDMSKLVFLVPLVVVLFVNMVLYLIILRTYKQVIQNRGLLSYQNRQEEKMLQRKTCLYQAVFFICWCPSIFLGSASFTEGYTIVRFYPVVVMQVLLGPLQGMLNSIVYGWQRGSFRQALTERTSLLSTNRSSMMSVTL